MNRYTEILSMQIPSEFAIQASKIARALDPDVGGAESFQRKIEGYEESLDPEYPNSTPIYSNDLYCSVLVTEEFKAQALGIFADTSGETLFTVVQQDYANRWSDLEAPTLEDCKAFIANLTIS